MENKSGKDNDTEKDKWRGMRDRKRWNAERNYDRHCVRTKVLDGQLWMELEANPPLSPRYSLTAGEGILKNYLPAFPTETHSYTESRVRTCSRGSSLKPEGGRECHSTSKWDQLVIMSEAVLCLKHPNDSYIRPSLRGMCRIYATFLQYYATCLCICR